MQITETRNFVYEITVKRLEISSSIQSHSIVVVTIGSEVAVSIEGRCAVGRGRLFKGGAV